MAIIHCPNCARRISSLAPVCPHCHTPLGELTPDEQHRLKVRRWKATVYRAANLSYLALTLLVVGSIWWWFHGPDGWALPPPAGGIVMITVGAALYVVARFWLLWLRLKRNRP
jgi:hypothetical protein